MRMNSCKSMKKNTGSVASGSTKRRLRRKESTGSDDFSIEELFPDDMGYDADVEVIRPDHYEDAESGSESEANRGSQVKIKTIDEELAERMHHLGRDYASTVPQTSFIDRGRKRTSWELDNDGSVLETPMSPDFEVQEMVDHADQPSAAKRRKKKSKRSEIVPNLLRNQMDAWTDSSGKPSVRRHEDQDDSLSTSHASEEASREDVEAMDIS